MASFFDFIGAAAIATVATFFSWFYVGQITAARGERAGLFAALGLMIGLAVFGTFPIVSIALNLLHQTQFYQYVRIAVVLLCLVIVIFAILDFRKDRVRHNPGGWTLFRIFFFGLLMHLITPLPLELYRSLLGHGGATEVAVNLLSRFMEINANPFADPLRTFTLPVVAFVVYLAVIFVFGWAHEPMKHSDVLRMMTMVLTITVFLGAALYVSYNGLTYEKTLVDKVINLGMQRLL